MVILPKMKTPPAGGSHRHASPSVGERALGIFFARRTILIATFCEDDGNWFTHHRNDRSRPMTYEYDFEMVKRAYAEMARRAREKDEVRRLPRNAIPMHAQMKKETDTSQRQPYPA